MVRVREMVGETDKTDRGRWRQGSEREEGGGAEEEEVSRGAAEVLGEFGRDLCVRPCQRRRAQQV